MSYTNIWESCHIVKTHMNTCSPNSHETKLWRWADRYQQTVFLLFTVTKTNWSILRYFQSYWKSDMDNEKKKFNNLMEVKIQHRTQVVCSFQFVAFAWQWCIFGTAVSLVADVFEKTLFQCLPHAQMYCDYCHSLELFLLCGQCFLIRIFYFCLWFPTFHRIHYDSLS